jgi:hypothetical protein
MSPLHCGCGRDNDPWRKFCGGCGAALGSPCSCGFANRSDDRFCGGCGTVRRAGAATPASKQGTIPIDLSQIVSD